MTEAAQDAKAPRDRSPSYPIVPLRSAIDRLEAFETFFKRHPAPLDKVGLAWGMKGKSSQVAQVLAALKSYGLLESDRASRQITISEEGRTYLRAQQDRIKHEILKRAALRPRAIAEYWNRWRADRPPDEICMDELVLKGGFTKAAATNFIRVYDATIDYAGLTESDKAEVVEEPSESDVPGDDEIVADPEAPRKLEEAPSQKLRRKGVLMEGERELTTGLLSKDASFRLIVSGPVGEKEIERLIKKLELDKEILAAHESSSDDAS